MFFNLKTQIMMKTILTILVSLFIAATVVSCHTTAKATVSKEKQEQIDKDKRNFEHNMKD
jgi:uncharacterized alpha/beta hydrolase family protein